MTAISGMQPDGSPPASRLPVRLPDFIIAGAMKCGTTSLHHILARHPRVFIPPQELFLFDLDDLTQHPDFFIHEPGRWLAPDLDSAPDAYFRWYATFFERASADQLLGEDSTTYLASEIAVERLARIVPNVKLIVMLRDPTSRTYSHYWHLVRSGRAVYSFEDALRIMPEMLIQRSLYRPQVQRLLAHFPRERIQFIQFERFIRDMQSEVDRTCHFLGIDPSLRLEGMHTHFNEAVVPRSIRLQLLRNRLRRRQLTNAFALELPTATSARTTSRGWWRRQVDHIWDRINPVRPGRPPAMKAETRQMLNRYFLRQNKGLDALTGLDTSALWYRDA